MSARASGDQSIVGTTPVVFQGEIVHRETEVREDFFHRDTPPAMLFEPSLRTPDCLAISLSYGLIIDISV